MIDDTTETNELASMELEQLRSALAFTLSDHQRLLRKSDVVGFCDDLDMCFEYSERVRCGPCAIRQAEKLGVETDHSLPFAPEQYRLRRCLAAYKSHGEAHCEGVEKLLSARGVDETVEGLVGKIRAEISQHLDFLSGVDTDPIKRR